MNLEMYNAVSTVNGMRYRKEHVFSPLSDELLSKLQERKKETDKNGSSKNIDPKPETYWSERRGERIKEFELPPMDIN